MSDSPLHIQASVPSSLKWAPPQQHKLVRPREQCDDRLSLTRCLHRCGSLRYRTHVFLCDCSIAQGSCHQAHKGSRLFAHAQSVQPHLLERAGSMCLPRNTVEVLIAQVQRQWSSRKHCLVAKALVACMVWNYPLVPRWGVIPIRSTLPDGTTSANPPSSLPRGT